MRLQIRGEVLLSRGRGGWALEGAGLLLAVVWSARRGARGPLGRAPAAGGQGSQAGGAVREAQALVHVPSPPPLCQLRLQALDLLPQSVVVLLQGLVLLVQGVRLVRVLLPAALGRHAVLLFLLQLPLVLLGVRPGQQPLAPAEVHGSGSRAKAHTWFGVSLSCCDL